MKNDRGKYILVAALLACFAALFWLCGSRETVTEMYDYHHALRNDTVSIELQEGGNLVVHGEGKLSGVDMIRLMDEGKIKKSDPLSVDIDDRVTELGYYIANGYSKTQALNVGTGVKVIHNGAVKNCAALEYVFLPEGLEKVGADFMYGCPKAYVVTDGPREALPELPDVAENRILANVHSYGDLIQRRNDAPMAVYGADALVYDDPAAAASPGTLNPGFRVSSPAITLDPGTYTLRYFGSGLDQIAREDVSMTVDGAEFTDFSVFAEAGVLSCKFTLSQRAGAVGLYVANSAQAAVGVSALNVYDNSFVIPPAVVAWWD